MIDGNAKRAAIRAYRSLVAPLGRRALERVVRDGLPSWLDGPARFLLGDAYVVDGAAREVIGHVEGLRSELAARADADLAVAKSGFESPDSRRSAFEIAHVSSVSQEWGTFLYLTARAAGARNIVELGACAGISSCYLASAPSCERFVTVEGSERLARIAAENLARTNGNARVVNALFDEVLEEVLEAFPSGVDLAYVDGHKDAEQLQNSVARIVRHLVPGGVLVLDDIRWSRDLAALWSAMCEKAGFSYALDLGRFGLCIRDAASARPRVGSLAPYTAWLRRVHH